MSARRVCSIAAAVLATISLSSHIAESQQQRAGPPPSIEERTAGTRKIDGYFPLYWDERAGTLLLEIPRFDTQFLFSTGLSAGLGSNDIGLDRGGGGLGRVVLFQRMGPRVMLVQPNQSFRSSSANPRERKSVEESFAKSILWGFPIAAESNGHVLVDATPFFLRDIHGAGSSLRPGAWRVDATRSAFYLPNTRGFPKNTEIDAQLNFFFTVLSFEFADYDLTRLVDPLFQQVGDIEVHEAILAFLTGKSNTVKTL